MMTREVNPYETSLYHTHAVLMVPLLNRVFVRNRCLLYCVMARPRKVEAKLGDFGRKWANYGLKMMRQNHMTFIAPLKRVEGCLFVGGRAMETDKIVEKKKGQSVSEIDRIHLDLFSLDNHPQGGKQLLFSTAACQLRSLSLSGADGGVVSRSGKKE